MRESQFYIDKTRHLEQKLKIYSAIYIEGAPSTGKSVAVQLLLQKYPDVTGAVIAVDKEDGDNLKRRLRSLKKEEYTWIIFENMPKYIASDIAKEMVTLVNHLQEDKKAIFVGRDKPQTEFLELLWKNKMELISQHQLAFTKEEIRRLLKEKGSRLKVDEVLEETGGWAGSVDMMTRMSLNPMHTDKCAKDLKESYEISAYLQKNILAKLTEKEKLCVECARKCPWINEKMCEQLIETSNSREILEDLTRKGLLLYQKQGNYWAVAPLMRGENTITEMQWDQELLGHWYEEQGFVKEAIQCYAKVKAEVAEVTCIIKNYDKIPFSGVSYEKVIEWQENTPQICYLRGMYYYEKRDFKKMEREIKKVQEMNPAVPNQKEVLLNLQYANPNITLDAWLEMIQKELPQKFGLYQMAGNSHMALCGLRDLGSLFACTKKEENRKAKIWKDTLGKKEWELYCLAKMDYYLETQRKDMLKEDDWKFVKEQNDIASLYLLLKQQRAVPTDEIILDESKVPHDQNAEAIRNLYSPWFQNAEQLTYWLKDSERRTRETITEENYVYLCSLTKGYMLLNQYEKAEKLVGRLISYLKEYRRERFVAELLFQQAIINWHTGRHGQALQNTIESFLIGTKYHYVGFYAGYGQQGITVLEAYVDWRKNISPESWNRKKKYQYGNVLRMPEADYLDVILRSAKKLHKWNQIIEEQIPEERLTMMENIILQEIGQGLSNAEICEKLNLKLPTVKSHLSNLYKKLGVNSRTQAVLKGKEIGINME